MEEWRAIPDYEGRYEVSDLGRVRSLDRIRSHGHRWRGRVLKPLATPAGYLAVNLWIDNTQRTWLVHRLVLSAFVGKSDDDTEAMHADGDRSNNALLNLSWGTHSNNVLDQVAHGTHNHASKTHCPSGHPYDEANTYVYPGRAHRGCRACRRNSRKAA